MRENELRAFRAARSQELTGYNPEFLSYFRAAQAGENAFAGDIGAGREPEIQHSLERPVERPLKALLRFDVYQSVITPGGISRLEHGVLARAPIAACNSPGRTTSVHWEAIMAVTGRLTLAAASLMAAPAWAQDANRPYYGDPHMWDGGWWMFLGPLWMIVVIGVLIAGVVLLVRWLGGAAPGGGPGHASRTRALDMLKERFARGEIDKDEFEERRRLLGD